MSGHLSSQASGQVRMQAGHVDRPVPLAVTGDAAPPLWSLRVKWDVSLDGAVSGRLRAGVVLGLRLCADSRWREAVTQRMLSRLDARL